MLNKNTWNYLTVCKQMSSGLFEMLPTNYLFTNHIFNIYVGKEDLALDNL